MSESDHERAPREPSSHGSGLRRMFELLEEKLGDDVRVHVPSLAEAEGASTRAVTPEGGFRRYEILGEIARGGVGVILRARDRELGRDVAIKVLQERFRENESVLQRFFAEAQIAGQLQHPGVVPIYEIGLNDERLPYIAMKLVEGETLAQRLERGDARLPELVAVFEQICRTTAYAHARRVVHRDLKPSNVMLSGFGQVQIVDWGFAKVLGSESERLADTDASREIVTLRDEADAQDSLMGTAIGTPAYMPPEQALGDVDRMDARSDVFALGAILCELLTGKPLYVGTREESPLLQSARTRTAPARERLAGSTAPGPLRELAEACIAEEPEDRPADAGVVAERVADYSAGLAERARQAELSVIRQRARAQKTIVIAALCFLLLALGAGTLYWVSERERAYRERLVDRIGRELEKASVAEARAQNAGSEALGLWESAAEAARRAKEIATELEPEDETRRETEARVHATLAQYQDARWFGELAQIQLAALEQLESSGDELEPFSTKWTLRLCDGLDQGFAAAFAQRGFRESSPEPRTWMRDLPEERYPYVAGALDTWAAARRQLELHAWRTGSLAKSLWELSSRLDTEDSWRHDLRGQLAQARPDVRVLAGLQSRARTAQRSEESYLLLAQAWLRSGRFDEAIEVLRDATITLPTSFLIRFQLGYLLRKRLAAPGDAEEALRQLEVARSLRPASLEALLMLAQVQHESGRLRTAIALLEELLRRSPQHKRARVALAHSLWLSGRESSAIEELEEIVRANPAYLRARLLLDEFEAAARGKGDTFTTVRGVFQEAPAVPSGVLGIARVLQRAVRQQRPRTRVEPDAAEPSPGPAGAKGTEGATTRRVETAALSGTNTIQLLLGGQQRVPAPPTRSAGFEHFAALARFELRQAIRLEKAASGPAKQQSQRHYHNARIWFAKMLQQLKSDEATAPRTRRTRIRSLFYEPEFTWIRLNAERLGLPESEVTAWRELWKELRTCLRVSR